jgi:NADPH-dependent 2,4-dienoyl-CoA reductase/sulfur reductase-like enzyme
METNITDIYAAGDCVTVYDLVTNDNTLALLAGPAVRQGRIAGINAVGGSESYPGSVNSFIVSSRTFFVGIAGINNEQAKELGIEAISASITAPVIPHYMPESKDITIKMTARLDDGKILGSEVLGEVKVDANVNYVAMALQTGLTVYDLMNIDFCYAPAVSETIYPIVKVADAIIRKISRKKAKNK